MRIKKLNKTHAEVLMYGNIGGWFIDGFNFASIIDGLEAEGYNEATFRAHCYGGSVFEGDVIGTAFSRSKLKINIIIDGIAASMMAMILPYVPVENISIAENGFGMIHRPFSDRGGDASQHLAEANLLFKMEGNFIKTLSKRSGLTAEEIKSKFFDGADHWLNADEMIQYKLASAKIETVASIKSLDKLTVKNMTEQAVYGHYAAKLDPDSNIPENQNFKEMKKELIEAFQLKGVTAESSDTAVLAALTAHFKSINDKLEALETKAKTEAKNAITAAITQAGKDGKLPTDEAGNVTADARKMYEGIGESSGVDVLNAIFQNTSKPKSIMQTLKPQNKGGKTPSGGGSGDVKDWNWYQEHASAELETMPSEDPDLFKQLFKAEFGVEPEM